ncbi:hypothetical protein TNCV_2762561 [Trichonephila clavipes]|nr:hypothetical protein TNCV_2762561 [Trichonephila clavipes]
MTLVNLNLGQVTSTTAKLTTHSDEDNSSPQRKDSNESATLIFGYHFDMAKKCILTHDEIDRYMNNSDELSEDGLEYSDDVDFYLIVCHLMKIRIATVKIVLAHKIKFRI